MTRPLPAGVELAILDLHQAGAMPRQIAAAFRKRRPPLFISTARVREILSQDGVMANDAREQAMELARARLAEEVAGAVAASPRARPFKRGPLAW